MGLSNEVRNPERLTELEEMLPQTAFQSHILRFGLVQLAILMAVFVLEVAQMNINKWGDSWGAGCIVGVVGFCLLAHWYAINRHQEKIDKGEIKPNQCTSSNQFGWMSKQACIFTGILFTAVLAYQLGQIFLWPTVWKESRYENN